MKKKQIVLSAYFIVWVLIIVLIGQYILPLVFLGIYTGIIYSGGAMSEYSDTISVEIGWTCFAAVFTGSIIHVFVSGLVPVDSFLYHNFSFWGGFGYVAGCAILNAPFNFWIFSGD